MSFMRLLNGEPVDCDREGMRRFLDERGLVTDSEHETSAHLLDHAGNRLAFDGSWTDLHIDPLNRPGPIGGGIWHATLSDEECQFIFDLCVAAGFLVCNHQGDPYFVVPRRNHELGDLEAAMDNPRPVFAGTASELRDALSAGFADFIEYRNRVISPDQRGAPDVPR